MTRSHPVIIEAAVNGMCSKARNPAVPKSVDEIIAAALDCLAHGASIIHVHTSSLELSPEAAAEEYSAIFRGVLQERSDAHLYPTGISAGDLMGRTAHFATLVERGLIKMGYMDPGTVNIAAEEDEDGLPVGGIAYVNTFDECRQHFEMFSRWRLAPNLAVYEPGFLRVVLAYWKANRLPAGAFVKFYFGGNHSPFTGRPAITHGLPPNPSSLDALLAMYGECPAPWAVSVFGGDIGRSSVLPYALELGGHVRVGLEDYGGERQPTNIQLIDEVTQVAARMGLRPANPAETAAMLGMS